MTQEEKAKRYDEAIERAKAYQGLRSEMEIIFPELKESEDERIRKEIFDCFRAMKQQGCFPSKHKEQYDSWIVWLEKQGEQNPAWSEEDEEIYRKCICAMRASACGFPEEEKFVEQVDNWLKSLKDRVQPKPMQELSEEDKSIVTELIGIFESAVDGGHVSFPYRLIKDYIRVLKSCLPQTTWKPSDDEMKALAEALSLANNCGEEYAFDLRTLQDQLKKLK